MRGSKVSLVVAVVACAAAPAVPAQDLVFADDFENADFCAWSNGNQLTWYEDLDGDGFGDSAATLTTCAPSSGWVSVGGDCDDTDPDSYPGAAESCNGVDNDCDGTADNDPVDGETFYRDDDGDGYGLAHDSILACFPGNPYGATVSGDCDDGNPAINPGASEVCDGADNDCDGETDEGTPCDDGIVCTADACSAGSCVHTPNDAFCDDGIECTAETCEATGCVSTPVADGTSCSSPSGGFCLGGVCSCPGDETACNGTCTDTSTDPQNCGTCDAACSAANATPGCFDGFCFFTCHEGFADCDGTPGCETSGPCP